MLTATKLLFVKHLYTYRSQVCASILHLPLGLRPDVLYAFGAGAATVVFFSCRLPNVYAGDLTLLDSLMETSTEIKKQNKNYFMLKFNLTILWTISQHLMQHLMKNSNLKFKSVQSWFDVAAHLRTWKR